jgi:hypothetical protein
MDTSRNGAGHTATILIDAKDKSSSQACELENKCLKERPQDKIVWARAAEIVEDAELKRLVPPPGADEQKRIDERLVLDGPVEPLIVWAFRGRRILLVGYDRIALFKRHGQRFPIIEREFPGREEARLFIIKHCLARPNLTSLEISYLRGLRYNGEKAPHGGDRKTEKAAAELSGRLKSAEALAEIFCVSVATIRRDGALAAAVKRSPTLAAKVSFPSYSTGKPI